MAPRMPARALELLLPARALALSEGLAEVLAVALLVVAVRRAGAAPMLASSVCWIRTSTVWPLALDLR